MTARDRIVIMVVLAIAAVAASWMFLIQPRRAQASKLATQVSAEQTQLSSAESEVVAGEAARNQFPANYTQVVRLGEAVPADDDVPSLIYQLQGAANAADVNFSTLQVQSAGSSSPPPSSSSSSTSSSTSSSALPPGVAIGPAGFPVEQFSFSLQGNFFHLANFFKRLQSFVTAGKDQISIRGRLLSINGISLGQASQGFPEITANVSATAYLVQSSQGLLAGATPVGPAGASTSTTTQTSNSSSTSSTPAAAAAVTPVIR